MGLSETYNEGFRPGALRRHGLAIWGGLGDQAMAVGISGTALLQASSLGLAFITSVLLTHTLGASGYGAYAYAMAWVGFLLIPAVLGMDRYLVRGIAMYRTNQEWGHLRGLNRWANRSVITVSVLVSGGAAAIGYAVLPSSLRMTFVVSMPIVPVTALVIVRQSTMTGLRRVVSGQFPEFLVRPLLYVLVLVPFALVTTLGLTSELAAALNLTSVVIAFVLGAVMLHRAFPTESRAAEPQYQARTWRRAAIPMMLLGGMWMVNGVVATIMLGSIRGAHDAGLYAVVVNGSSVMTIGLLAVTTPLAPRVAEYFALGDMAALQSAVTKAARLAIVFAAPVALILICFGHTLLGFLFGHQFASAGPALAIMALGQLANSAAGPAGSVLTMTKHERAAAVGVGSGLVANIILCAILVPRFGVIGAAIGAATSMIVWNGALTAYAAIKLHINTSALLGFGRSAGGAGGGSAERRTRTLTAALAIAACVAALAAGLALRHSAAVPHRLAPVVSGQVSVDAITPIGAPQALKLQRPVAHKGVAPAGASTLAKSQSQAAAAPQTVTTAPVTPISPAPAPSAPPPQTGGTGSGSSGKGSGTKGTGTVSGGG